MASAWFRFLPDLPLFLPHSATQGSIELLFQPGQSIKHLVESAGVPHTEIGVVTVNGAPATLAALAADSDTVALAPPAPGENMPPAPLEFVLDGHLGRLAAGLRMLGFDALYQNDSDDAALAQIAAQGRILLTRDRRLLMRKIVQYGYCLRSLDPAEQLVEVVRRYRLERASKPFQRCLRCNTPLEAVDKAAVFDQIQPLTRRYYDRFHRCPACGQVYWPGSHYEQMLRRIDNLPGMGKNQSDSDRSRVL